jgi:hypothetical protein
MCSLGTVRSLSEGKFGDLATNDLGCQGHVARREGRMQAHQDGPYSGLCFGGLEHLPPNMTRKTLERLLVVPLLPLHDQFRLALARGPLDPDMRDEEYRSLVSALLRPSRRFGITSACLAPRGARPCVLPSDDADLVIRFVGDRHGLACQPAQNTLESPCWRRISELLAMRRSGRQEATQRGSAGTRDVLDKPSISREQD